MEGRLNFSVGNDTEWTVVTRRKKRPAQKPLNNDMCCKEMKCEADKSKGRESARGPVSELQISTFVEHGQAFQGDVEINVEVTVELGADGMSKAAKSKNNHMRFKDERRGVRKVPTDEEKESRLLVQMHQARRMVEASPFYSKFMEQLRGLCLKSRIYHKDDGGYVPSSLLQEGGKMKGRSGSDSAVPRIESGKESVSSYEDGCRNSVDRVAKSISPGVDQQGGTRDRWSDEVEMHCVEENRGKASMDVGSSGGLSTVVEANAEMEVEERRLLIVVYGVGSIASAEVSRCQMALACLLASELQVEGRVEVFDPVLTCMEIRVLASLGASTITHNEVGKRVVDGPTVFFMPHCEAHLYENVLLANRQPGRFRQIAVLGNSFAQYQHRWTVPPYPNSKRPDFLLKVQEHVEEHEVHSANFPVVSAFNDMSWHFFPNGCGME